MVRRAGCVIALFLALVFPATADVSNAELIGLAEQYQSSIVPADASKSVTEILKELNEARKAGDVARIIRLSEQLVAQGDHNAQSWLSSVEGLGSERPGGEQGPRRRHSRRAGLADEGDRLEAVQRVTLCAAGWKRTGRATMTVARPMRPSPRWHASRRTRPDQDNPDGLHRAEKTRDDAQRPAAAQRAEDLGDGGALDEVQWELQAGIPVLNVGDMQGDDRRLEFMSKRRWARR